MEKINITGTEDTPEINIDLEAGIFSISGRSLPEDVTTFYEPVIKWLESYSSKSPMECSIRLEYFNTASSKIILDILMKLEELAESSNHISIKWYYDKNDEDMLEAGEEFSELVEIPFEMVKY